MLSSYNIEAKQTTVKNPTANSLVKRIHLTLEDQLHTKHFGNNYIGEVDYLLQIALFAIRAATPSNCTYSPSQLAYRVDMFFCQQIHINWLALKAKCQKQFMANNEKENRKQLEHTYKVNDLVLILKKPYKMDKAEKISLPTYNKGLYRILEVFNNGTVKILQGAYTDIINIRRLIPYYKKKVNQ
jgi:hypothetical protein